jgi:uncharacterized protein (DUF2141 family)
MMKNLFLITSILCIGTFNLNAQDKNTFNLTVNIAGLKSDKGTLLIGLYNKKETFLKNQFKVDFAKIKNKKSFVIFKNLPK